MNLAAITFAGRCFSSDELAIIRQAAADYAGLGITEIARTICEWLDWKRPSGTIEKSRVPVAARTIARSRPVDASRPAAIRTTRTTDGFHHR